MLNLDSTDNLEGLASVTNVVDFTFSGVDGTTLVSSEGKLSDSQTTIRTASGILRIYSLTLVNTHSAAVTVTISKDPANAGTLYRLFSISLGIGYAALFDGVRLSVFDALGGLVAGVNVSDTAYAASWDAVTTIAPSKNAVYDQMELRAPKATPTFTGQATIPTINLTGGQIAFPATAVPSADPNTMDDYEEGTWTAAFICTTGTITINPDRNTGSYTKIGRLVTLTGYFDISAVSSPVGDLNITGNPFDAANLDEYAGYASGSILVNNLVAAIDGYAVLRLAEGSSTMQIYEGGTTGTGNDMANHFGGSTTVYFSITFVAA